MRVRIERVPSADWRTENLEELWKKAKPWDLDRFDWSLHQFLEYCCLLRSIRQQYEADDRRIGFDAHAFFLCGGYFAFKYLNRTTPMALRATIFGGLNHGRHPKLELPRFVDELRNKALSGGRRCVDLLIVDEVKSGTGMGTVLNLVEKSMSDWPASSRCDINVHFYAISPGSANQMTHKLRAAVSKWQGKHKTNGGVLSVDVRHFLGRLPVYDCPRLRGVERVNRSADLSEAYEVLKSVGGAVRLSCDFSKKCVFERCLGESPLVEFLSYCAEACTCEPRSAVSKLLAQQIRLSGCPTCDVLYLKASGQE